MMNDFEKVQLTSKREFISSKNTNEKHEIYITSLNLEVMLREETDEISTKIFSSLLHWYQETLQAMTCSEFVFDFIDRMFYIFYTMRLKRGSLDIVSPN